MGAATGECIAERLSLLVNCGIEAIRVRLPFPPSPTVKQEKLGIL